MKHAALAFFVGLGIAALLARPAAPVFIHPISPTVH